MEKIKCLGKIVIENLDNVIALLIGAYATWYGYTTNNQELIIPCIAATLTIISFSFIRDRMNRQKLSEQIKNLEDKISSKSERYGKSDKAFFTRKELTSLSDCLKKAHFTLDISGTSLASVCNSNQSVLEELLEKKVRIRLLVSNPDNMGLQECLAKRFKEVNTPEIHRNHVMGSIHAIQRLLKEYGEDNQSQIHFTDQAQTFSYIGKDVGKEICEDSGIIQVEFYLHNIGVTNDPILSLHPKYDAHWYKVFKDQFEYLWKTSSKIK